MSRCDSTDRSPKYPVFSFEPSDYAEFYGENGYVLIPGGASPEFMRYALHFTKVRIAEGGDSALDGRRFNGNELQIQMDFPDNSDYPEGVNSVVASVAGLDVDRTLIGERHITIYDPSAEASPPPHKDSLASEVTVGVGLRIPEDSRIVMYPDCELTLNPYPSTKEWRDNLDEEDFPENVLAGIEPVEIDMRPGDVVMFAGNSIYHGRINPSNTWVLYMKFNGMRLDPICRDPKTMQQRVRSLELLGSRSDEELLESKVEVSPRLEKVSRQYVRMHWMEAIHGHIIGENSFRLSETEFSALRVLDDRVFPLRDLLVRMGYPAQSTASFVPLLRRLIRVGAMDLHG